MYLSPLQLEVKCGRVWRYMNSKKVIVIINFERQ
jgi:hypothetical protein